MNPSPFLYRTVTTLSIASQDPNTHLLVEKSGADDDFRDLVRVDV